MRRFFFLIALLLAFWLGTKIRPTAPALAPLTDTRDRLQQILDVDYADYQRLKTLEEKYKKADEILGKMMVILMADFQLHVSRPVAAATAVESAPTTAPTTTPTATPLPTSVPSPSPRAKPNPAVPYLSVQQVHSEEQRKRFAESKRKDDLRSTWTAAQVLNRFPPILEGCFVGTYVADKDKETATMTMFHKIIGSQGQSTIVTRFKNGGVNRTRGNGKPNDYRRGEHQEIMIVSGDWVYDLFFVPNLDGWAGNVYQIQKDESRIPIGEVQLARGSNCEQ